MSLPNQPRVLAVTNQKGGVGKTTTAINLGAALADAGAPVLIIDIDPQGNASTGLGIEPDQRSLTTYDLMLEGADISDVIQKTAFEGLDIAPATTDLSSTDIDLVDQENRVFMLKSALNRDALRRYAYVLIDCPPSLSLLTVNALAAADAVLVPLQAEFFALEGLSQLMLTIRNVRETANPDLRIDGIALTMVDQRNNLAKQVEDDVRNTLGDLVMQTMIPRNVRVSEAPSFAVPVTVYDPSSKGSQAYRDMAKELLDRAATTAEEAV
jgi:chromosome partitioning protein